MSSVPSVLEDQLWLWLESCEEGKPVPVTGALGKAPHKVVPFLQYGVREGREASEAGVKSLGLYYRLQ